jgi:hypothetical protein
MVTSGAKERTERKGSINFPFSCSTTHLES